MKSIVSSAGNRIRFRVRLTPRAHRNAVVGWTETGHLKVRIAAPPVEEAANRELIRFFAKRLGVSKAEIVIIGGFHSKTKQLEVPEACKNELLSFESI